MHTKQLKAVTAYLNIEHAAEVLSIYKQVSVYYSPTIALATAKEVCEHYLGKMADLIILRGSENV